MRKRTWSHFVAGASAAVMVASLCTTAVPQASNKVEAASSWQMESLDRGLVAVKSGNGIFLSWRLLGTENYATSFNVYRDGVKIAGPITDSTNYFDAGGNTNNSYIVRSVVNGTEVTESDVVKGWGNQYKDVRLNKPANVYQDGTTVTYSANDATVADVDGDGAYEIILKWDPSNAKDNSQSGYTSNVYVDCYELDGTQKWRIDLGKNIRAGAHYTQMAAYDFDGDGKAELALKTADGTKDGSGTVIGNAYADNRNSSGYILTGNEYLTMFNGATGKAMKTINYEPARGNVSDWGDKYGNRVDRFLCGVAYLDGRTPSLIECRGYYEKSMLVAYKWANGNFTKQWTFTADGSQNSNYRGEGAHSLSIADVDNDGFDEIVYGACVIDHNGRGLYRTGQGHGDALHCGDFDPNRAGQEIFMVHENKASNIESVQMRDARTGTTLWSYKRSKDIGRGLILNAAKEYQPYVCLADNAYDSRGNVIDSNLKGLGQNFSMLWDADLYQEGLDQTTIRKWNSNTKRVDTILSGANVHSCNGTKATPTLSADILGDWREEVIWAANDDTALRIYTTTDVTSHKLYTLMSDRQYREAVAWQNVAYNQPPHTSYYIGEDMRTPSQPAIYTAGNYKLKSIGSAAFPSNEPQMPETGELTDGVYMVRNVNSGLYLDVNNGVAANDTNIQQWGASSAGSYNSWRIEKDASGYYTFYSLVGDGKTFVMDVYGRRKDNGTNIALYISQGSDNQKFELVQQTDGSYAILTKITGSQSCVEVVNAYTNSGANVQQWPYTGHACQRWYFEKIGTDKPSPSPSIAPSVAPSPSIAPSVAPNPSVVPSIAPSAEPSKAPATSTSVLTLDAFASSWTGAYTMSVKLENAGTVNVEDWKIELNAQEADINSIWCAQKAASGSTITLTPESYNAAIGVNGSTTFGYGGNGSVPSKLNYTLSYKVNGTWYSYEGTDTAF
ncbi:rhamnogalacturonan lyase family protein [[Clostridium] polysaccharolyticum]|uniref:Rhamnogalacturonan endolyase n=1 Tax=[Clostridium] polysaccharolyticum TaxID=29364 RepID=A0A1I0EIU5_9FIRM|nr:RICIN domain-containing protein [[Clostridium] polysaccharolyticum]SET45265.1 rhamnogalacturonan endolyase [[Clostridium] polysaccharolyticum]